MIISKWRWLLSICAVAVVLSLLFIGTRPTVETNRLSVETTGLAAADLAQEQQVQERAHSGTSQERAPVAQAPGSQPGQTPDEFSDKPPAVPERPTAIVLDAREVSGILGRDVRSAANEDMGRIVDVIVDQTGRVRAAVIDFGGFLGVGSRKIAVDWVALRFSMDKERYRITLELTRDQVKAAPEYQDGKPIIVLGAALGPDGTRLITSARGEK